MRQKNLTIRQRMLREKLAKKYKEDLDAGVTRYQVTEDFNPLGKRIQSIIRGKARKYANLYRNRRLYEDDFESEFWVVAWELASETHYDGGTPYLDKLNRRLDSRAISVVRKTYTEKRRAFHEALPLDKCQDMKAPNSVENHVTDKLLIEQMANDPDLTDQERAMFHLLSDDPDMTLQELADELGLSGRMQASRVRDRLFSKLRSKYSEEETN